MFARNFQVKLNQNEFNQKAKNSMTSEFVKDKLLNSFFFLKYLSKLINSCFPIQLIGDRLQVSLQILGNLNEI